MSIYYGDMEGQYPNDPNSLTINGKYMASIPVSRTPDYHADSSAIVFGSNATGWLDTGKWIYDNVPTDPAIYYGSIFVDCTDTKGTTWTSY